MEAVRIIKEMRGATNGQYPRFAVWENVPGAFSSNNGEDFRIVLQELIKIAEPYAVMPEVPKNGWAYADCFSGDGWSLAYRVFDAQHWGVPQRRRRIYLVADFRGGCAEKILFEREGLRGYFTEGGKAWQTVTPDVEKGIGADDREGAFGFDRYNQCSTGEVSETVRCPNGGDNYPTVCYGISSYDSNAMKSDNPHSGIYEAETSRTLDGNGGNPACNQGGIAIVEAVGFDGYNATETGEYMQVNEEKTATLLARDYKDPTVVIYGSGLDNSEVSHTLIARMETATRTTQDNLIVTDYSNPPDYIVRRLTPTECARLQGFPDKWGHPDRKDEMTAEEYGFWREVRMTYDRINGRKEKRYTDAQILKWYNSLHNAGAEFKMWGNGIALPNALYVLQGIKDALDREQTARSKWLDDLLRG